MHLTKDSYRSIKAKVFQKDLLDGTIIGNLQKIFVMPIYKELSNLHLLPIWRTSMKQGGSSNLSFNTLRSRLSGSSASNADDFSLCEASDYMKRICEHFKALTVKLDTHLHDEENMAENSGEEGGVNDKDEEEETKNGDDDRW